MFTNEAGHAINRGSFNARVWKPALVAAGIEPTRANGYHALRHHFASVLLAGGVSIPALADYLGHADPGFTLRVTPPHAGDEDRTREVIHAERVRGWPPLWARCGPGPAAGVSASQPANDALSLLVAVGDAAAGEVVGGDFDGDAVAGEDADVVLAHLAADVAEEAVAVVQLDAEHRVGEGFLDDALEFQGVFLHAAGADAGLALGAGLFVDVAGFADATAAALLRHVNDETSRVAPTPLRPLRVAVQLLTRVPAGVHDVEPEDPPRSAAWFALVGGGVGVVAAAVLLAAGALLGSVAGAVLAVATAVLLTGGLHEDGLADTADGLWLTGDRERRLAAMRDSRVGAFGVLALLFVVLLRVSLLAALPLPVAAAALVAAHALARVAPVALAWRLPAAVSGLGSSIAGRVRPGAVATCALTGAAIAALAGVAAGAELDATINRVLVATVIAAVPVALLGLAAKRRLGGLTGDILGAATALAEVAVLATVVAMT